MIDILILLILGELVIYLLIRILNELDMFMFNRGQDENIVTVAVPPEKGEELLRQLMEGNDED